MYTTLSQKEPVRASVPAWQVSRVARFLSVVGFSEAVDVEGAPARVASFFCNDCQLHLAGVVFPDMADAPIAIALLVPDPEEVAARCWTDGYTVEVEEQPGGEVQLTVVGPCELRITLERASP